MERDDRYSNFSLGNARTLADKIVPTLKSSAVIYSPEGSVGAISINPLSTSMKGLNAIGIEPATKATPYSDLASKDAGTPPNTLPPPTQFMLLNTNFSSELPIGKTKFTVGFDPDIACHLRSPCTPNPQVGATFSLNFRGL